MYIHNYYLFILLCYNKNFLVILRVYKVLNLFLKYVSNYGSAVDFLQFSRPVKSNMDI